MKDEDIDEQNGNDQGQDENDPAKPQGPTPDEGPTPGGDGGTGN